MLLSNFPTVDCAGSGREIYANLVKFAEVGGVLLRAKIQIYRNNKTSPD